MNYNKLFKQTDDGGFVKHDVIIYIKKLKNKIKNLIKQNHQTIKMRNYMFENLQKNSLHLEKIKKTYKNNEQIYNNKIKNLENEILSYKQKISVMQSKEDRYDNFEKHSHLLNKQAHLNSINILEEAKEEAGESLLIIDSLTDELNNLRQDIEFISKNLKYGTKEASDLLFSFYNKIEKYNKDIESIKLNFYQKHNIN